MPGHRRDPGFLYVADSKLATGASMDYIDARHGRFVTILPRSRAEDAAAAPRSPPGAWTSRPPAPGRPPRQRPAADLGDSSRTRAVRRGLAGHPGPVLSQARAGLPRPRRRITRAMTALDQLAARLGSPRCKLKTEAAITRAAGQAITAAGAGRWVSYAITRHDTVTRKQISTGRPGPNTRYQDVTVTRCTLHPVTDTARAARDAASDGCFPLITNDKALTPPRSSTPTNDSPASNPATTPSRPSCAPSRSTSPAPGGSTRSASACTPPCSSTPCPNASSAAPPPPPACRPCPSTTRTGRPPPPAAPSSSPSSAASPSPPSPPGSTQPSYRPSSPDSSTSSSHC